MMNKLRELAVWLDDRLHLTALYASTAGHEVPSSAGSWFYVFGSATLLCFVIQVITGTCLAFVYVPSTNEAFTSLEYLNHAQFLGWYLRAVHYWGSNFMVFIMTLHMIQVFLFGAYKYPRELTWVSGIFLLLFTLAMAFTGQVMRFDQDAYWGLSIGASVTGRVPLIGGQLVHLLLAGPIIAGETLSRFFTLHVFILPGLIIAIVSMHLRLVLTKGINEYPKPGVPVKRSTYDAEYAEILRKEGVPFVPHAVGKDLVFAAATIVAILGCALFFGPKGPLGVPNPTLINTNPRPDFYFLSIFAALALLPDWMEVVILFVAPAILIGLLLALPFISGTGEKSFRRRPVAVLCRCVRHVGDRHINVYGRNVSVVTSDVCLERHSGSGEICQKAHASRDTRRACISKQAVPELSLAGQRRRAAWPCVGRCCDTLNCRRDGSAGDSGRRQHAGLRKETHSPRSRSAGRLYADAEA